MPVTGDFRALNAMVDKIRAVAGDGPDADRFRRDLLTQCAAGARDALDEGFIKSTDPYGKQWKPLVSRKGKPLLDTGRLSTSYTYEITDNGFTVGTNVAYAPYHQFGAFIAPHSRLHAALAFDKNGRFISVKTKKGRKLADKYWLGRVTYKNGTVIPKRQMVPQEDTGGIGDRWGKAINEEAAAFFKSWFKQ